MGFQDSKKQPAELFRQVPVACTGEEVRPVRVSSAKDVTLIGLAFHSVLTVRSPVRSPDVGPRQ